MRADPFSLPAQRPGPSPTANSPPSSSTSSWAWGEFPRTRFRVFPHEVQGFPRSEGQRALPKLKVPVRIALVRSIGPGMSNRPRAEEGRQTCPRVGSQRLMAPTPQPTERSIQMKTFNKRLGSRRTWGPRPRRRRRGGMRRHAHGALLNQLSIDSSRDEEDRRADPGGGSASAHSARRS